ncbi:MAG: mandelate racemase/muconate lactonizing enzyme family protein [Sneathiella sp.]
MKITRLETLRLGAYPNIIWVQIHTDEGITGLGETFFGATAVEAYIHDWCAPKLIGENPRDIPRLRQKLGDYIGWRGAGVETRACSAIDIALWDIFAQSAGLPLCDALGGRSRDKIRTYNTCAGYEYIRDARAQTVDNWGAGNTDGPYEDLQGFLTSADELAYSLLEQGITAMKIWPFDVAAERSGGFEITPQELETALQPFEKIRNAVGDKIDIMVEFHSLWSRPMANKLAQALRPFKTLWHEDPFRLDSVRDLKEYARHTDAWICASETLPSVHGFREYLETGVAGVVMLDLSWCGGLSEARKIAAMAEAWHTPVAPHDCTGPVVYTASCHFSLHAPNTYIQESVRAFYTGWYKDLVTDLPLVEDGFISLWDRPGLGITLNPDLFKREDACLRDTAA